MKAVVSSASDVRVMERPDPRPGPGQVLVRIKTAALNHRDLRLARTRPDEEPVVLGSDGAGILEAVGEGVSLRGLSVGDEVVINPSLGWINEPDAPPPDYHILGVPEDGTFAEWIVLPAANVEPKPAGISWEEAAAFPLAALTAYRATVTRAQVAPRDTVVVTGISGGVATYALQIAKAFGARVIVTSRSEEKLEQARQLGADAGLNSDGDWPNAVKRLTDGRGADAVIETVGPPTFAKSLESLRSGGRLVFFAATEGDAVEIPLRKSFYKQVNILGTTMGNQVEFRRMLALVAQLRIRPVIDTTFPLAEAPAAFDYMERAAQFGKIVLRVAE